MRKEMLERTYQGHKGIEKSKRLARNVLYWPGMGSEIHEKIARCNICQQHQKQNAKEPMIPSQSPRKPWEKVATDLFTGDKSEYFIIADYHSRFFEVAKLSDTKSNTVTILIKSAFAHHGIPSEVISDNGSQYSSKEFESFSKQWELKHTTTSPLYPQLHKQIRSLKNQFIR